MDTIDKFQYNQSNLFFGLGVEKYPPVGDRRKFPSIKEIAPLMAPLQIYKFLLCNPPNLYQSYPTIKLFEAFLISIFTSYAGHRLFDCLM